MLLINQAAVSVSSYQHHKSVKSVSGTGDTGAKLSQLDTKCTPSSCLQHCREREAESAASQSFRQNGNIKTNDQD